MPIFDLLLKADLENVAKVTTISGMRWYMKVSCANCHETSDSVYVTAEESISTGRGESNYVQRCKGCRRENSIDIVKKSEQAYTSENSGNFSRIIQFDCRGLEPIAYEPRAGFVVESEEGSTWEADFSDDFAEYDEKAQTSVGVYKVEGKFEKAGR